MQPVGVEEKLRALKNYRTKTDVVLKPVRAMKKSFTGLDGKERPLSLRYYQVIGVLHLIFADRFILGDDCGLGKTIQTITALAALWERGEARRTVVVTIKSSVRQWEKEFYKFLEEGTVRIFLCVGSPAKRKKIYEEFLAYNQGPVVLIVGYATLRQDITIVQGCTDFCMVCDEATAFKNPSTRTWQVIKHLAGRAHKAWGLSATIIKNKILDGYGIYSAIVPTLFSSSRNKFVTEFCITRLVDIPGSRRKILQIEGSTKAQVAAFREKIDLYFLGRAKHEVASELPTLTIREEEIFLSPGQRRLYSEIREGCFVPPKKKLEEGDMGDEPMSALAKLTYYQQAANHPKLCGVDAVSSKFARLLELVEESDLSEEKIIIYTRFREMVDLGIKEFEARGIRCTRITGKENKVEQRDKAQSLFQSATSGVNVIWITNAASESINLQAAKAIVFYDTPWTGGEYIQIIGRMVRIGSLHDKCLAIHLIAKGTIDKQTTAALEASMETIEGVLGKRLQGEREGVDVLPSSQSFEDLLRSVEKLELPTEVDET